MTHKKDFIEELSKQYPDVNKGMLEKIYESTWEILTKSIKKGKKYTVSGFGTFKLKERKARIGRNPKTGEKVNVAASKTIGFKATASLKDTL